MNIFHPSSLPSFYHFFYITVCTIICAALSIAVPESYLCILPAVAIFGAISWYQKSLLQTWMALACAGMLISLHYDQRNHLYFQKNFSNKIIHISGKVDDVEVKNGIKTITLTTTSINDYHIHSTHPYKVLIHIRHKTRFISVGDTIRLHPIEIKPTKASGYDRYLKKEGIFASIYISDATKIHIITHPPAEYSSIARVSKKLDYTSSLLFNALFFGKKSSHAAYHKLKQYFNFWGVGHYLARSGLHVTLLFILILSLLSYIPLPWYTKQGFLLTSLGILFLYTVSSTSFIRACIFYTLSLLCNLLKVQIQPLHILNLTLLGMIMYNPYLVFFLDFQLTFAATYILMWMGYLRGIKTKNFLVHKNLPPFFEPF